MKNYIVNHMNYSLGLHNPAFEAINPDLPSLTVPGMTLSLQQLLEKYVQGGDVAMFPPVYAGDVIMPNIERMTVQDRLDLSRELAIAIKEDQKERVKLKAPSDTPVLKSPVPPGESV